MKFSTDGSGTRTRCRVSIAHIRHLGPDSGLGFQVNVLEALEVDPSSLGGGAQADPVPSIAFTVNCLSKFNHRETDS